jgi:pyruvate formate lyase activating enzyme
MEPSRKYLSKRQFIKYGLLGSAGLFFGLPKQLLRAADKISSNEADLSAFNKSVKGKKEALFYSVTPRGVKCGICPNECTLKEGELSECRNRTNTGGKLYTLAYGNPCAVHVDPVEKKPLLHFLPQSQAFSIATAGCNLACLNCQNWTISQTSPDKTRNYDLMPEAVVREAGNNNCLSIAYTYSEPITFYEYVYDTSKLARQQGIKNILVSNGYINEKPLRQLCKYTDAANIDLKAFDDSIYLKLTDGKLNPILNTLKVMKEEGVWLEITNLVIPGWTDDFDMIRSMCDWLVKNGLDSYPLHFSRFHPQYKLTRLPATPVSTLVKARETAMNAGMKFVYIGNAPGVNAENTYCPGCKKMVVERKGFKIISNHLNAGHCGFCNEKIPGVWN